MRTLPPGLAEHLAAGATTLAHGWRLTRRDGLVQGFTDHDRALTFQGTTFEPSAGFAASEIPASVGLAVDTAEVVGALVSPTLTEADLAAGLYDGVRIELWLVNWRDPAEHLLLGVGELGEITRCGHAFKAEMRALSHRLDQEMGRLYQSTCDATFGDARCGVDLLAHRRVATVAEVLGPRTVRVAGLETVAPGAFARGLAAAPEAAPVEIRDDRAAGTARLIDLWEAPVPPLAAGASLTLEPGCDKTYDTCTRRYGNGVNFRGCPHMPGNDFALSYPRRGEGNDGGAVA